MGRAHRPVRASQARVKGTPYPIGTRLAESYGIDLNREKRMGLPADGIGRRPTGPLQLPSSTWATAALAVFIAAFIGAAMLWKHSGREDAAVPPVEGACENLKEAVARGGFRDEWLPPFVPESASGIRWWSDRKSGFRFLLCAVPEPDLVALARRDWPRVAPTDRRADWRVATPVPWWPTELRAVSPLTEAQGWRILWTRRRFGGGSEFVAIHLKRRRLAVWLVPYEAPPR